jgi:exosome complex component RRP40
MFVLPGTDITSFIESKLPVSATTTTTPESEQTKIHVGPGIIQTDTGILALRAGLLSSNPPRNTKFTLQSPHCSSSRYLPAQNDLVIGIVTARLAELFRVDIGGPQPATLPLLAGFEGATKKSRPAWPVGTVIFARVSGAHPDLEPELACFDPSGNIPNDTFGELSGEASITVDSSSSASNAQSTAPTAPELPYSQLLRTSCSFSRSLQLPSSASLPLLKDLASKWSFELAAGANGRVFVAGASASEVAHICRALLELSIQSKNKLIN